MHVGLQDIYIGLTIRHILRTTYVMEDPKNLKVKNWKEIAKHRRTGRHLAQKAKTHKEFQ